jgi:hypothetical protein
VRAVVAKFIHVDSMLGTQAYAGEDGRGMKSSGVARSAFNPSPENVVTETPLKQFIYTMACIIF